MRVKVFSAIFAAGGFPANGKIECAPPMGPDADHFRRLLACRSNHDRLAMAARDPSLEEILARPWWKGFHGFAPRRFPGHRRIWAPLQQIPCEVHIAATFLAVFGTFEAIVLLAP